MNPTMQPLPFDPAAAHGLSERLLRSHHENNDGGAVKRLGAVRAALAATQFASVSGFALNGLKREELLATNSMLLHELHFASMGGDGGGMAAAMALALRASFGSVERWREEFIAMGRALGGGSGWVLLVFQPREGTLVNQWADDTTQALAAGVPILALDMDEHSYHLDFGAQAGAWVDAFMCNLNWPAVYERYQLAVHAAAEPLAAGQEEVAGADLIDVRRAGVFQLAQTMLPAATWRDPEHVRAWSRLLDPGRDYVVYCVYGHELGRGTALRLRAQGLKARFLRGGIDAWQTAGLPVVDKGVAP